MTLSEKSDCRSHHEVASNQAQDSSVAIVNEEKSAFVDEEEVKVDSKGES